MEKRIDAKKNSTDVNLIIKDVNQLIKKVDWESIEELDQDKLNLRFLEIRIAYQSIRNTLNKYNNGKKTEEKGKGSNVHNAQ